MDCRLQASGQEECNREKNEKTKKKEEKRSSWGRSGEQMREWREEAEQQRTLAGTPVEKKGEDEWNGKNQDPSIRRCRWVFGSGSLGSLRERTEKHRKEPPRKEMMMKKKKKVYEEG